jgi:sulfhydrogenase subunit delta
VTEPSPSRLAVFKLSSCDGCQLQLLDAEDALLELAGAVDVAYFREATGRAADGPFDVTLVEGSITTEDQVEEIVRIRAESRFLVTIGACATTGGIQALRNWDEDETAAARAVYPTPAYIRSLARSTPVSDHVRVDLELPGCPVDRGQLLGALASLLAGVLPRLSTAPVCVECKRRGFPCVVVTRGDPCLGPVTRTGCGALCPGFDRACFGCFGPADGSNVHAMAALFRSMGMTDGEVSARFRLITGWDPRFREAATPKPEEVAAR